MLTNYNAETMAHIDRQLRERPRTQATGREYVDDPRECLERLARSVRRTSADREFQECWRVVQQSLSIEADDLADQGDYRRARTRMGALLRNPAL